MKQRIVALLKILLPMLVGAAVTEHATGAETVPRGCTSRCKEQYQAIPKYDHAFNGDKEEKAILKKAFGEPVSQPVGDTDSLVRYHGQVFDFFTLVDSAGTAKLIGVVARGNPAYARIPDLDMGEYQGKGKPTKWYFTLADLSLGYTLGDCHDDFSGPYAGSYVLTPACYFGRPGHYSYFAFQYSLVNQPCLKDIESLGLQAGLKKCPQNLPATAAFIWDQSVARLAKPVADIFAAEK